MIDPTEPVFAEVAEQQQINRDEGTAITAAARIPLLLLTNTDADDAAIELATWVKKLTA